MTSASSLLRQRGLTLVEVMVGIAIGMIAMIVMFQTVTVWDARTRATSAGSDAQIGGNLAMYSLEHDLRLAGLGFGGAAPAQMGCPLVGYSAAAASAIGPFPFVPVVIVDGVDGAPDRIATLYGSSPFFTEGETFTAGSQHSVTARSRIGFKAGDVAVVAAAASAPRCHLVQAVDNPASGSETTLTFDNTTSYTDFYAGAASAGTAAFNDPDGISPSIPSGYVFNLGPKPRRVTWQVSGDTLGYTDDLRSASFFGVSEGIVDMKAEYGYDEDGDTRISGSEWRKSLPTPTDWTRVRAIHVALLARSRNFEKPVAASSNEQMYVAPNPVWFAASSASGVPFVMRNVDGTPDANPPADPNNWRFYRYRVYEKVIPLRNVIWGQ